MYFDRKITGVCFGGGAALGFAHIGVIKAFEECGISPEYISGASMGAIIGALYAQGYSSSELEQIVVDYKFNSILKIVERKRHMFGGLSSHAKVEDMLFELIPHNSFEELKRKLFIGVTEIETPRSVMLSEGNLIPAILASMSIPFFFEPVIIDGKVYVDGGVMNNLPVDPLVGMCSTIIGADVVTVESEKVELTPSAIAARSFKALISQSVQTQKEMCDLYISFPELSCEEGYDFGNYKHNIEVGYNRAIELLRG